MQQIDINKQHSHLIFYGMNEQYKLLGGLKLACILKRLNELDRHFLYCRQNGIDFRRQVEEQLLSTDSDEIKRLIA